MRRLGHRSERVRVEVGVVRWMEGEMEWLVRRGYGVVGLWVWRSGGGVGDRDLRRRG